jgi:hypothetical protein
VLLGKMELLSESNGVGFGVGGYLELDESRVVYLELFHILGSNLSKKQFLFLRYFWDFTTKDWKD